MRHSDACMVARARTHTHAQPHESDCDRRPWEGKPNGERGSLPPPLFSRYPHGKTRPQILHAVAVAADPALAGVHVTPSAPTHARTHTHTHRLIASNHKRNSAAAADNARTRVRATDLSRGAGRPRDGAVKVGGCPTATAVEGVVMCVV
jgi:hypothetical protein